VSSAGGAGTDDPDRTGRVGEPPVAAAGAGGPLRHRYRGQPQPLERLQGDRPQLRLLGLRVRPDGGQVPGDQVGGVRDPGAEGGRRGRGQQYPVGDDQQRDSDDQPDQPLGQRLRGVRREARQDVEQLHPVDQADQPGTTDAGVGHPEADHQHAEHRRPGAHREHGAQRDQGGGRRQRGEVDPGADRRRPEHVGQGAERDRAEHRVGGHHAVAEQVAAEEESDAGRRGDPDRGTDRRQVRVPPTHPRRHTSGGGGHCGQHGDSSSAGRERPGRARPCSCAAPAARKCVRVHEQSVILPFTTTFI